MFNILAMANNLVKGVNKNSTITINRKDVVDTDGIITYETTSKQVIAQVQPLSQEVIAKDTYLQSVVAREFWIQGLNADILNFFNSVTKSNSSLTMDDKEYSIYKLDNWSNAGFIKITGVLNENTESTI